MKILFISLLVVIAGCARHVEKPATIEYIKDARTGFCFATTDPSSPRATLATVPCTPEVETLIGKTK